MRSTIIAKAILKAALLSKKRQALLLIAFVGLFLSSFSLLTISSAMKGLQDNVKLRSKSLFGHSVIYLKGTEKSDEKSQAILKKIQSLGLDAYRSSTHEILLSTRSKQIRPMVLSGIDVKSGRFGKLGEHFFKGMPIVLSSYVAHAMDVTRSESLTVVAPQVSDELFGEVPRSLVAPLASTFITDVPEFDDRQAFVRSSFMHNLFAEVFYNRIVILSDVTVDVEKEIKSSLLVSSTFKRWEEFQQSLNWALSLESSMMLLLFSLACLLISISIIAGLLLYFDNIKRDLASLFVLGMKKSDIKRELYIFSFLFNIFAIIPGLLFSLLIIFILDQSNLVIMPDLFIDRSIPFKLTAINLINSIFIPWVISMIASVVALKIFFRDLDPVKEIRS